MFSYFSKHKKTHSTAGSSGADQKPAPAATDATASLTQDPTPTAAAGSDSQMSHQTSTNQESGHPSSASSDKGKGPMPEAVTVHAGEPILDALDQAFIEQALAEANENAPPLPPRSRTPSIMWEMDSDVEQDKKAETQGEVKDAGKDEATENGKDKKGKGKGKGKGKEKEHTKDTKGHARAPDILFNIFKKKKPAVATASSGTTNLEPVKPVSTEEAQDEEQDLVKVLERLGLAAGSNNMALALSTETAQIVQQFTQIFKDLVNGVPTAYGDLQRLIEDHDGTLSRNYDKLPSSVKKLITTLPQKLTSKFAPELLAVAAEAQGMKNVNMAGSSSAELKTTAAQVLNPATLSLLLKKPGAVVTMLKSIANALKARWPAFMGTNVVWAVALSILMFMFWYCYKRGREERIEREKLEAVASGSSSGGQTEISDADRVEELPDDPTLPAAASSAPGIPSTGSATTATPPPGVSPAVGTAPAPGTVPSVPETPAELNKKQ